ncbi:MAG: zinc ribbon domain-containing protein [Candidatus Bathyarchaeia archaeon]
MTSKSFVVIALLLSLALFSVQAFAAYVPHQGDYFSYYEVQNLGSGTGDYSGYTEQTIINGTGAINGVTANGTVSAYYSYSYDFSNSSGSTETGGSSGNFTFSSNNFLYINGTDDQTGYVNPTVWFCMDNSIPEGGTFTLLNTLMTVKSTNYSYFLPSQNRSVYAIYAQGESSYERNDVYGQFTATYTWDTYFDPSSGYIIGYDYTEHDSNPSGTGFTYTENLYINSASYPLTTAPTASPNGSSDLMKDALYIAAIVIIIAIILIIIYAASRRRRRLQKHPSQQPVYTPPSEPPSPPPPQDINLTPKQAPVQQIVIKEVVKVKCRYCGALIDSTAEKCPFCGAPRS